MPTPNQVESNRQEALKDRKVNGACSSGGDDTKGPDLHSHFSIWLFVYNFHLKHNLYNNPKLLPKSPGKTTTVKLK